MPGCLHRHPAPHPFETFESTRCSSNALGPCAGLEARTAPGGSATAGLLTVHLRTETPLTGWVAVESVAATAAAVVKGSLPGRASFSGLAFHR